MQNPSSLFHHAKRRRFLRGLPLITTKTAKFVDFLAYPIGILGLLSTAPQVYDIWVLKETAGVSFFTWSSWTVMSLFWIWYARVHRARAMVLIQTGWFFINTLVAVGILVNT